MSTPSTINTPADITANYADIGAAKAALPFTKALVLAILAGAFIGVAGIAHATASILNLGVPAPLARLMGAMCFPTGLAMVVLAGGELFTGDCLMTVSVFAKKISVARMLRLWAIVYLGNFIGGVLIAALAVYGHTLNLYDGALAAATVKTAATKCSLSFQDAFLRGILCNFLVAGGVWMALAAKDAGGKVLSLFLPVMIFVVCGYEHCVANMYSVPAGLMLKTAGGYSSLPAIPDTLTWLNFAWKNLVPVTLGNIVGGSVFLGAAYWYIYGKRPEK